MTGENPNPSASNAPSAKILFSSVVIVSGGGSFLGYFFSSLVLKKSWLFAAIPIMNAVTWLFVCALITKSCLHDLRWDFRIPRAVGLFRYYYTIWFPFVLLSLPVGLWNENPLAGLVADLTYQVLGVVAYFVARVALYSGQEADDVDGVLLIQWNRAAVSVGIMSAVASVGVPEIGLLFPILLIVSLFYNLTFGGHPAASFMMALPLLMNLRDWNRTILTTVLLSIVLYLVVGGIFRLGKFLAVAAAVALVASGPLFVAFDLGNSRLGQRISEMTDFDLDPHASKEIAVSQRFFEAEAVFDEFRKATPFAYLTGFGVGATFDMQGSRDDSVKDGAILGESRVHNIHFLPVAIFFRHGLVGLALLGYFALCSTVAVIRAIIGAHRGKPAGFEVVASFYLFQALVEGLPASGHFITNPVIPFLTAYLDHESTMSRRTLPRAPSARSRTNGAPAAIAPGGVLV